MKTLVLIIIISSFYFLIKAINEANRKSQEAAKFRSIEKAKRKEIAWNKIRFIQSLSADTRKKIYEKYEGVCEKCGSREKLCFFIKSDSSSGWNWEDVTLKCSNCKGFSVNYPFDRKKPYKTEELVYDRDNGECIGCGSTTNLNYDHIIPFKFGGASADADNMQLLCKTCNCSKNASFKY